MKFLHHHRILFGLGVCLVLIITGFAIWKQRHDQILDAEAITLKADLTVNYGEKVNVSDFLEKLDGDLVNDYEITPENLGENEIEFEYINTNNKKRHSKITFNVVDATPPQIFSNNSYTVYAGYNGNIIDLMPSGDNLDDHPQREIIGEYYLDEPGSYALNYVVTDSSGNQSHKHFTLHVIERPQESTTTTDNHVDIDDSSTKIPFADIVRDYKTADTQIGIDVSEWQAEIDWEKVKQAGAEFAMIRLGYQKGYDGELVLDPYFQGNIKAALKQKLPVGVYFYSYAKTTKQAEEQVKWIKKQVKPYQLDLGIAFDWENWQDFNQAEVSFATLNHIARTFITKVEEAGYTGMLYGSKNYLDLIWEPKDLTVWLAQYYNKVTYSGNYRVWQITDRARIDGIESDVDVNILYHNKSEEQ